MVSHLSFTHPAPTAIYTLSLHDALPILDIGIREAQAGNRIGDISAAIQRHVEGAGFSVVESFVGHGIGREDRKSTRLNSSHVAISYAVFCLKKKTTARNNE